MRPSESIAVAYFAVLAAAAWIRPRPVSRRISITAIGVSMCGAIVWLSRAGNIAERDWAPVVVILIGYYLSGQFFNQPSVRFERWLIDWDRRLLGDPIPEFDAWPTIVIGACELAYMGTFLLIPLGCFLLMAGGHEPYVNRYWTLVVAAEFGSFAPLAFLQSRPPWAVDAPGDARTGFVRRCGLYWVKAASHCANTFPSGHAAGSLAVALGVLAAMPVAGSLLVIVALMIGAGCITGRYHYAADVLLGFLLTLLIWTLV